MTHYIPNALRRNRSQLIRTPPRAIPTPPPAASARPFHAPSYFRLSIYRGIG